VSREVIVICGLLQLVAAILIFYFASSTTAMYLLAIAALFVMLGSLLWPTAEDVAAEKLRAATTAATLPQVGASPANAPGAAAASNDNSGL
jgi:fucose permease